MTRSFKNLTQLNKFEKQNKKFRIVDIEWNGTNKIWNVTFKELKDDNKQ